MNDRVGSTRELSAPLTLSFAEAFRFWLKLGFISFGGPAGQIAIMHQELVTRRRWISDGRFLHALNYCMLLPGPEAQQLATYIGWLLHGTRGGLAAGGLFVLPSLLLLIALAWIYVTFGHIAWVAGILNGMKPAVVAIVAFAGYRLGSRTLKNATLWMIALLAFTSLAWLRVPFPIVVIGAGVIGIVGGHLSPRTFHASSHGAAKNRESLTTVIDDATPTPAHALFRWSRTLVFVAVGVALWIAIEGSLIKTFGWHHTFSQMGWFFSKAAMVTFGGAYAVLPYVQQAAVEQYQWLSTPQMIDGLALGETTPGPLIMIVAFVGFLGGWNQAGVEPGWLAFAGIIGASVATFFTFLPSFLFILIGGPAVEATRDDVKFVAPLTAISAAVTGVILNLALYFAYHVFWPRGVSMPLTLEGLWRAVDAISVLISGAGLFALIRFKVGVIPVILTAGALGLVRALL
ncbi:MAG: chromate efflux transporter [Povalibacter sp.]